jgi:NitT/TauT family transport system permease protein
VNRFSLYLLRTIPLLLFVGAWELYVRSDKQRMFFFGSPIKIGSYFVGKVSDGSLPLDAAITLTEALLGFLLGNAVGAVVGLGLWFSPRVARIAQPYITALGSAPVFAFAPIVIIWFGTGISAKVAVAAISTVFVALAHAYTGATQVSVEYLDLMRSLRASESQVFRKVVAPSAIVWVTSAFRLNIGFALLGAFIGEFISSSRGLGHLIIVAGGLFDISLVFCGVLSLVALALLLDFVVGRLEIHLKRGVVKWL